VIRLAISIVSL